MRRPSLPLLALSDDRLTLRDLRVLLALSTFERKGACSPDRKAIADLTRLKETRVSESTSRLVALGWLQKTGKGGRATASSYVINWEYTPAETVPNSGTVLEGETVPNSGTVTINRPQFGDGLGENGPQFGDGLAGHSYSSSKYIYLNQDLNPDPDQLQKQKDSTRGAEPFGFSDALQILVSHGMPEAFAAGVSDNAKAARGQIAAWISNGLTAERLTAACTKAMEVKRGGGPIGPRLVEKILGTMKQQAKGDDFDRTDYAANWSAGHAV